MRPPPPPANPDDLSVEPVPVARPAWQPAADEGPPGPLAGVRAWVYGIGLVLSVIVLVRQTSEIVRVMPALRGESTLPAGVPEPTVSGEPAPQLIVAFGGALVACAGIVLVGSI